MPTCVGRLCGDKFQYAPDTVFRYTEKQCKRACAEGSDLCKICEKHEEANMAGNSTKWHGRMGAPLPPKSHVEGSDWNIQLRLKEAAKAAKALGTVNEVEKAEKKAAAALKVAATEERKAEVALRKEEAARKRASHAVAKAEKALVRKTKKNRKTSTSRSKSRKSSSSVIYRPASAATSNATARSNMSGQWSQPVRRGTPISSNRQEPNPATLQGIAANIAGLPELE